jgi:hypothetical protein
MSQENVEIVRAAIDAFQHDEEAWLRTLDPDLVWYVIEDGHIPRPGIEGRWASVNAGLTPGRSTPWRSRI